MRAQLLFEGIATHRVLVSRGARLAVAIYSPEGGNDDFDLSGATTSQVRCGPGRDTVTAHPPMRVWGSCELVNGEPWQTRVNLGRVAGGELDAAPGGIAWIDPLGVLHLRPRLYGPERTIAPPADRHFGRLDVGLGPDGAAVATLAVCDIDHRCGSWRSFAVASARRVVLPLPAPRGCVVRSVARWRARIALGVNCRPDRTSVVLAGKRFAFASELGAGVIAAPAVDLRGDLLTVDANRVGTDELWAVRLGDHGCRRLLDLATGGDAGRARIAAGERVLWPYLSDSYVPGSWGTVATIGSRCELSWRYGLPDRNSQSEVLVNHTLVRASYNRLTAEPFVTVPPPLWPVGPPSDFSDEVIAP